MPRVIQSNRGSILAACAITVLLLSGIGVAVAQNAHLAPRYGTVVLNARFTPDPHSVSLVAGGSVRTSRAGCRAYVADAPDIVLDYRATVYALNIYVQSSVDTTLLVNRPDGTWMCDDDGGNGNNPLISFPAPMPGEYAIYVGTFRSSTASATLYISELPPAW